MIDPREYFMLQRAAQQLLVDGMERFLEVDPNASAADLLTYARSKVTPEWQPDTEPCRHCGRATVIDLGGRVNHLGEDGGLSRGCRAASFRDDPYPDGDFWDNAIPRNQYAARM